jgi:hypothetical protein
MREKLDPWSKLHELRHFTACCDGVEPCQTQWLKRCLARNRNTDFGRRYAFDTLVSVSDYQKKVPLVGYQALQPYISRIAHGEENVLFSGTPKAFELTGGSGGGSKLIPYSYDSLVDFQTALLPWLGEMVTTYGINSGSVYLTLSPALRERSVTAAGIPIGLPDSAYLGEGAGSVLAALSAVPVWVGELFEFEVWQLATLYGLVRHSELALISLWSPSFFLLLMQGLWERQDELGRLLQRGGPIAGHAVDADSGAIKRFRSYLKDRDSRHLWPRLKLVSCWMDGASRPYVESLKTVLPQAEFQGKGLLSTEAVVTVPNTNGIPLLAAQSGFYEFVDESGEINCAWELAKDRFYEVVVTTAGGLYRYRTGDQVRCMGMFNGLPALRFLGRNDLTSDMVGEKLTESFVAQCLEGLQGFKMLAPVHSQPPHYTLITEHAPSCASMAEDMDKQLMANPQYAYARKLGQLAPLTVTAHADPLRVYIAWSSQQQRLGDVKIPALLPASMALDLFMEHAR